LRRLRPVRTVGDQDVGGCCPACGHRLGAVEPLLSEDPVVDVVPDRAAFKAALRAVVLLVDVLDQRRPPKHLGELVEPLVLRYLRAVPAGTDGLRGGVRLLTFHPGPAARGRGGGRRDDPASGTPPGVGRVVRARRDRSVGVSDGPDLVR
jgi:hypothetical protein